MILFSDFQWLDFGFIVKTSSFVGFFGKINCQDLSKKYKKSKIIQNLGKKTKTSSAELVDNQNFPGKSQNEKSLLDCLLECLLLKHLICQSYHFNLSCFSAECLKISRIHSVKTRQKMALGERRSRESPCFLIVFK